MRADGIITSFESELNSQVIIEKVSLDDAFTLIHQQSNILASFVVPISVCFF